MYLRYYGITIALTWSCWAVVVFTGSHTTLPGVLFFGLGGLGPALAALLLVYTGWGVPTDSAPIPDDPSEFWFRLFDWRRLGLGFTALVLALPPAVGAGALLLDRALLGGDIGLEASASLLGDPLALVGLLVFTLVFGPIPEEIGWRGYGLAKLLNEESGPVRASLVVGLTWVLWHLPLFFMPGSYQAEQIGLGTVRFWAGFVPSLIALSVVITWVFMNTARSTLGAVLLHFSENLTGGILVFTERQSLIRAGVWVMCALVGIVAWRRSRAGAPDAAAEEESPHPM